MSRSLRLLVVAFLLGGLGCFGGTAWAASPPLAAYGKLPATELVSLSPSGSAYALVAALGDVRRLLVFSREGTLLATAQIGKAKVRELTWAGDDFLILRHSAAVALGIGFAVEKSELDGAVIVDLKAHAAHAVFGEDQHAVANTVDGFYGVAQVGGRWVGYFGGITYVNVAKDGEGDLQADSDGRLFSDLYRVDLATGRFDLAAHGRSDLQDWLLGPDGQVLARAIYDQRGQGWRLLRGKASGETILQGRAANGAPSLLGLGRTADTLLTSASAYDPAQATLLAGGSTAPVGELGPGVWPLHHPLTHLWIGVSARGGRDVTFFDPRRQARLRGAFKAFPKLTPRLVSFDADLDRMIVYTEGDEDSGTYWLIDVGTGKADAIGAAYPQVGEHDVGPVRMIDYKASDGLAMNGVLTLPPGRTAGPPPPLVVMPHGGPEANDDVTFDWWAQAFASRGYAVWQPNFRGSSGFGQAFRDAGLGQWGRRMQTDISDGVAALAQKGLADPHRACIVGASYGGYAALAGVTVQQGLYRCAVSVGGVSDPAGMLRDDAERQGGSANATMRYWRLYLNGEHGGGDLAAISPLRLAQRADAPILLIHGRDDTVVLPGQSDAMARALRGAGKPVELITLPGADHWLLQEAARVRTLEASVAFVLRCNPPDGAPGRG